jgi:hypothetical protein
MNFRLAILAAVLLSSTAYADTITVNLGQSNENYSLIGMGGTGGADPYGTYLADEGTCVAGATTTTCSLTGSYTGSTAGYSSGTYSIITTYTNGEGLHAISQAPVSSSGGNYFVMEPPFSPDLDMTLFLDDISGSKAISMVIDGQWVADNYLIQAVHSTCAGLPDGMPCEQSNVGVNDGSSIFSPVLGQVTFNSSDVSSLSSPVPEPTWLILAGLPGALLMLRRRYTPTA